MPALEPRQRQRGVAAVELALVLPLLLVLAMATVDIGRAIYHHSLLTQSVREAVRYLAMQAPGEGAATARNLVIYGNPQGTGSPVVPGLQAVQVPAPVWQTVGAAPPITVVTVRVSAYRYQGLFASFWGQRVDGWVFGDISASMRASQ